MNYDVEETADDRAKDSGDHIAKDRGKEVEVSHSFYFSHGFTQIHTDKINPCNPWLLFLYLPKHQVFQKRMMCGEARDGKAREPVP